MSYQHAFKKTYGYTNNFNVENEINIFGILCFISRKVKSQLKCRKELCAVFGEGAVTNQMSKSGLQSFMLHVLVE